MSDKRLNQYAAEHVPRCFGEVRVKPIAFEASRGSESVTFELQLDQSETSGRVFGHDLRGLNASYSGPATFMSPLVIEWEPSRRRTAILDTAVHGYHGEFGESAKF